MMEDKFGLARFGDGIADASDAIQAALDARPGEIFVPQGRYRVTKTLVIHGGTSLIADYNARFFMDGDTVKRAGDFLLTNGDHENGERDITVRGGVWDGNNRGKQNRKGDIFDLTAYSGTVLNFFNVKNLTLSDFTVANSVAYNIRMARIDGFAIENITFSSDEPAANQDGLHFNGEVRNGTVRNIRALTYGQTNDDLLALNADDSMERVENVGMVRGAIENLVIENLYAENCHTAIRILSAGAPIRNVVIRNVYAGFRRYAVNLDAARYCRTPLFDDSACPDGVGAVENVLIENMTCYKTDDNEDPAVLLETLSDGLTFRDFKLIGGAPGGAFRAAKVPGCAITADGEPVSPGEAIRLEDFSELTVRRASR